MNEQIASKIPTLEEIDELFQDENAPLHAPFDALVARQCAQGIPLEDLPSKESQKLMNSWEQKTGGNFTADLEAARVRAMGTKPKPVANPGDYFTRARERKNPYKGEKAQAARIAAAKWIHPDDVATANELLDDKAPQHNIVTCAAALTYARHGLTAIDGHAFDETGKSTNPNPPKDIKLPRGPAWEERASDDPTDITNFWSGTGTYPAKEDEVEGYPYAKADKCRNVNIVFKPGCKLFVIDVDGEEGARNLAALEEQLGPLPETVTSITGSGGRHIILRSKRSIMNTASKIAPKLDIRGEGGQIVAEPSIHKSGDFYCWEEGHAPGQIDIADAPDAWEMLCFDASKANGGKKKKVKPKAQKKTERKKTSGARRADTGGGWKKHLDDIGDDEGQEGFDAPINIVACAYFAELGIDAHEGTLKCALTEAILAAPCDDDRAERRYATDDYLDERIEKARAYIVDQGEAAEDDPFDITAPLGDTLGEALDSLGCGFRYVNIGGEGRFIRHLIPGEPPKLEVWTTTSLANWYADRKVTVATFDENGNVTGEEEINPVPVFFNQAPRWGGTAFAPYPAYIGQNTYNLFRGFTVQPEPGDCTLLKDFILDVICDGDESDFKWLWHWMAHLIQRPGEKPKTALVIWGAGGIGKGTFGRLLRALVHPYGTTFGDADAVVGRWSGSRHALNLVGVSEEAVFSGDRRVANALKHKVDHEECDVEVKNIQPITMPSYTRYVFDSNHPDAINIEGNGSERRYFVRRVSDRKQGDIEYFKHLRNEIDGDGIKALFHELMTYDPADVGMEWSDVFMAPETHDRKNMERETMRPVYRAYADMIEDGEFLHSDGMEQYRFDLSEGQTQIPKRMLNAFAERFADRRQAAETDPSRIHERLYGFPLKSRRARCKCYYRRANEHEAGEWVETELNVQCYDLRPDPLMLPPPEA